MSTDHESYLSDNTKLFAQNFAQSIEDMMGCEYSLSEESYKEEAFTPLFGMIVSIHFAGQVQGDYTVVLEEKTAASIIEAYEEGMEDDDLHEMREDYAGFVKECLNLAVGETIPTLEESFGELTFSPPVVIYGEIDYPEVLNGIQELHNDEKGTIQCGFSVNMANNKIGQRLEESLADLEKQTAEAKEANKNITTMLRLLPNALISIGPEGTILPGYSEATPRVVGTELEELSGVSFSEALSVPDKIVEDVVSWLGLVFDKYDLLPFKDLVDLCSVNEFNNKNERILKVDWLPVENDDGSKLERLFAVIEDVTEQRELEAKAAELRAKHEENLELISQVMNLEADEVTNFVFDSSSLLANARKVVDGQAYDQQFIKELFRTFHTLKSSSGQYNFKGLQKLAHHIESHLKAIEEAGEDTLTDHDVEELEHTIEDASDYIDRLQQMQMKLGGREETVEEKAARSVPTVMVPLDKINEIEKMVTQCQVLAKPNLDKFQYAQMAEVETQVRSLRLISLGFFKASLASLVENSAEKLKKRVKLSIRKDTNVDISKLRLVHKTLVHMVNNAIDHGIELPEERKAAGKFEEGIIVLNATRSGDLVTVSIEDDGRGIDIEKVRQTLIDKHEFEQDELEKLNDEEIFKHLFIPGFSTKDSVSMLSGRGVGMDYVYDTVVEKLGGDISVESEKGKGTKVLISFTD